MATRRHTITDSGPGDTTNDTVVFAEGDNISMKTPADATAVNAYKTLVVPTGKTWTVQSLLAQLVTRTNAENRQVTVDVMDNSGTLQVEFTTVTETAEGTTTAGSFNLTLTAANMAGSPKAIAVTIGLNISSVAVATLCVAALNADVDASALYVYTQGTTAGALNANIFATAKAPVADDATFNIAIPASLGLAAHASSTSLVPGVAARIIWHRNFTSVQAINLTYQYYASGDVADAAVSALTNYMRMNQMILPAGFYIRVYNSTAYTNIAVDTLTLNVLVDERTAGSRA